MSATQMANRASLILVACMVLAWALVGWDLAMVVPLAIITLANLIAWRLASAPIRSKARR